MYCSLQDAWPNNNIERFDNFNEIQSPYNENNGQQSQIYNKKVEPITKFNCEMIIDHIKKCDICKNYLQVNKKHIITEFFTVNPQIKETIIVFLFGLLFLFIINLFFC